MSTPTGPSQERIANNVALVREGVARAAERVERDPEEITIVAAAKNVPPEIERSAIAAGIRAIGHNYVQELRDARSALADLDVRWHYIGALRSGSANQVADLADVVETLSGERAIRRLAGRAARGGRRLDALIEVDFTGSRAGIGPDEVAAAAELASGLEGLRLRGLMTIPPLTATAEEARPWFRRLRELRDGLRERHPEVLDLSMGMSLDYEVAVEEGATMIRIGTALFGVRPPGRGA